MPWGSRLVSTATAAGHHSYFMLEDCVGTVDKQSNARPFVAGPAFRAAGISQDPAGGGGVQIACGILDGFRNPDMA